MTVASKGITVSIEVPVFLVSAQVSLLPESPIPMSMEVPVGTDLLFLSESAVPVILCYKAVPLTAGLAILNQLVNHITWSVMKQSA